ncbi:MAG: hypothetical protein KBD39_04140 [Sterolibacterium sp.]|nr:hypothetical protein [Sterolibacterium sp.]MBP9799287.1 hypothetical protein [Sterolibacterium sp.]
MMKVRSFFVAVVVLSGGAFALLSAPCLAAAGVGVGVGTTGTAGTKSRGVAISIGQSDAENESGVIEEDVEIEGITVINGEVRIDGVPVSRGTKKYRSAKTGKTYRIKWGKDGNVSVSEQ